jgi:PKD repeat protein
MPDMAPTAAIQAAPVEGKAPLHVTLSGALSQDDVAVCDYTWSFPDEDVPAVHAAQVEHDFPLSGDYVVQLTVTDGIGQCDTAECVIHVENCAPIASCRFSNDAPLPRENVYFDASASFDTDGQLVDYLWDFGDGATRRGTPVNHVYENVGVYVVRLTVVDNAGASATITHAVTVHTATPGGGCGGGTCIGL